MFVDSRTYLSIFNIIPVKTNTTESKYIILIDSHVLIFTNFDYDSKLLLGICNNSEVYNL